MFLRFFVTCGNDGDVRIWEGLDDDDPKFITVGEKAYSLALKVSHRPASVWQILGLFCDLWTPLLMMCDWFLLRYLVMNQRSSCQAADWDVLFLSQKGKLVTASSNNTVQIHTFPDGEPDGILTRFTTNATHVAFNSSGSRVAAGSRYRTDLETC